MTNAMKILIIGGSGFLSGTLARLAMQQGHSVWAVTRGQRPIPSGVIPLHADRKDPAGFEAAVTGAGVEWDLAVDCIAFAPEDTAEDAAVLRERVNHLVMISTDFVYDPARRRFPQTEDDADFLTDGYGGKKRQAELALQSAGQPRSGFQPPLNWTILRPGHIYGPGSQLGCLPAHGRDPQLLHRMVSGESLRLVGGGYFLQQPIFAPDLAQTILSLAGNPRTYGQIFNTAGPQIIESRAYYRIIANILGVDLHIEEIAVGEWLAEHLESAPFLCHRIYDLTRLRESGACMPSTPMEAGLRQHVRALLTPLAE